MAYDNNGVFTMPSGATDAFPGKVIASADWNAINGAVQTALTDLGQGCPYVLSMSGVAVPLTGGTGETALATVSVPAGALGLNGALRITTNIVFTNNGNNKTLRIRLGGISGTAFVSNAFTTSLSSRFITYIWNRNSAAIQVSDNAGIAIAALPTGTINTAVAQDLVISGQLANGSDTLTLESYVVEIFRRT